MMVKHDTNHSSNSTDEFMGDTGRGVNNNGFIRAGSTSGDVRAGHDCWYIETDGAAVSNPPSPLSHCSQSPLTISRPGCI